MSFFKLALHFAEGSYLELLLEQGRFTAAVSFPALLILAVIAIVILAHYWIYPVSLVLKWLEKKPRKRRKSKR